MVTNSVFATDIPDIAKKNACTTCHAIDCEVAGPGLLSESKKHKDEATNKYSNAESNAPDTREYPLAEGLMMKVSKGGYENRELLP